MRLYSVVVGVGDAFGKHNTELKYFVTEHRDILEEVKNHYGGHPGYHGDVVEIKFLGYVVNK